MRVGVVGVGDACVFEHVKVVVWVQHARGIQNKSVDEINRRLTAVQMNGSQRLKYETVKAG